MPGPQPLTVTDTAIDWNLVRERYLQGNAIPTVAKEFGIPPHSVRCRASREGWHVARNQALIAARQQLSDECHSRLIATVMKDIAGWDNVEYPARDSDKYEMLTRGRERLVNTAARLFGWDKPQTDDPASLSGAPVIDIRAKVIPDAATTASPDASDAQPSNQG